MRFACSNWRDRIQRRTVFVLPAVLSRLRYKLGFRDVAEMLLQRGYTVTHETIREWAFRFASLITGRLRATRRGQAGQSWYLDETAVKVAGVRTVRVGRAILLGPRRVAAALANRRPWRPSECRCRSAGASSQRGGLY